MRLYIIRHADPDYDNNTITPYGHEEAKALAARLANEGLTRIYTSPLGRAIDTARYTAEATGLEPMVAEWTREIPIPLVEQGPYGTLAVWDVPGEVIRAYPDAVRTHAGMGELPYIGHTPLVELAQGIHDAGDAFLSENGYRREEGRYRCVAPNYERIALFCHGGFGLAWLSHLLDIPLGLMMSGFWLAPSSVSLVFLEQRSEEWAVPRCIYVGDTGHLQVAGLPIRPRGIMAMNWLPPHE
jgi:probable phosphoglycerate mutase